MRSSIEKWVTKEDKALLPALTAGNKLTKFCRPLLSIGRVGRYEEKSE